MPAVTNNSKVLLTVASLDLGSSVRAAVRTQAKANQLKNLFSQYSNDSKLEFALIEDITAPGAFDESVKNVDAIIHSASPITSSDPTEDPQIQIGPAVDGTLEILKSAKSEPSIKRVVITSSIVALFGPHPTPYVYTEVDWNEDSIKAIAKDGRDAPPFTKYSASKTLAEKAAWKWVETEKPSFDLVTILPGYILGQIIIDPNPDAFNGSNAQVLSLLKKPALESLQITEPLFELQIVDIRDIATQHVEALKVPKAGGERFTSTSANITIQHILNILNANPIDGLVVSPGNPEILKNWKPTYAIPSEKAKKILGTTYRPAEDTIRTIFKQALAIGWTQ